MSDRLEERELLAKEMGWTIKDGPLGCDYWFAPGADYATAHEPDPYTDPADWMELAEWVRKQKWFANLNIFHEHLFLGRYGLDAPEYELAEGPLLTALPDAVVEALREMKAKK